MIEVEEIHKVLIAGGTGSREHSLGWKIKKDNPEVEVLFSPGHAASEKVGPSVKLDASPDQLEAYGIELQDFAEKEKIDLTIVGPDDLVASGIGDLFRLNNQAIFCPSWAAARLESSKAWAFEFMMRHGIPTAPGQVFKDRENALNAFNYYHWGEDEFVIKKDGLERGKGVYLPSTKAEARDIVGELFDKGAQKLLFQQKLYGKEVSIQAFSDGKNVLQTIPTTDYKRFAEGQPNTGGIGCFGPTSFVSPEDLDFIQERILIPTINGMTREKYPFVGLLYPGLMITPDGPKVIEFNARFGDPECEILMRLMKTNLLEVVCDTLNGRLDQTKIEYNEGAALGIVLASEGYPIGEKGKRRRIYGSKKLNPHEVVDFWAGIESDKGQLYALPNKRVGILTALEETIQSASLVVNSAIGKDSHDSGVWFPGIQYRKDIGLDATIPQS